MHDSGLLFALTGRRCDFRIDHFGRLLVPTQN